MTLAAITVLAGCGDSGKSDAHQQGPGMDPTKNAAVGTQFFTAVASNDPATVEAAYDLAAPASRALSYLKLVHDGLTAAGTADTMTEDQGTYKLCQADKPTVCHTFAAVTLSDGKVNDFTVDGKRIAIR
ncbi:hypothetical protein EFL95_07510 [Nocardioides marmorisolisilvae]|uniref:Uncharacterized protein n=1 Tax=Nocardioides marmorisolisilvae TaxID=1542737 RepID=A0A3N0DTD4_9ACTN|nr:hypothetical protein EFL95_07510 [Nocardioides marmorisolisilvae]